MFPASLFLCAHCAKSSDSSRCALDWENIPKSCLRSLERPSPVSQELASGSRKDTKRYASNHTTPAEKEPRSDARHYLKSDQSYILPDVGSRPSVVIPRSQIPWLLDLPDDVAERARRRSLSRCLFRKDPLSSTRLLRQQPPGGDRVLRSRVNKEARPDIKWRHCPCGKSSK